MHNGYMENIEQLVINFDDKNTYLLDNLDQSSKDFIKLKNLGLYIPDGFIVTTDAYFNFLSQYHLSKKIADLLSTVHYGRPDSLMQVANHIQKLIISSQLSEEFINQISAEYKKMGGILKSAEVIIGEKGKKSKNIDDLLNSVKDIYRDNFEEKKLLFAHQHKKNLLTDGASIHVFKNIKSNKYGQLFTQTGAIKSGTHLTQSEQAKLQDAAQTLKKHFYLPKIASWVIDKDKLYIVRLEPMTNTQKSHLVLIRHGESEWNAKGLWTGWSDPPLSELGKKQAKEAGINLKDIHFDNAYTSALLRAIQTLDGVKNAKGQKSIPTISNKALNERDYGAMTGKNKWEIQKEFGDEQFLKWRRGWDEPIPQGESLKDVYARVVPYYTEHILPKLKSGKNVIIAAHGNSLRALVKYLEDLSDLEVTKLEIPVGQIHVYQIDEDGKVVDKEIQNQQENKA